MAKNENKKKLVTEKFLDGNKFFIFMAMVLFLMSIIPGIATIKANDEGRVMDFIYNALLFIFLIIPAITALFFYVFSSLSDNEDPLNVKGKMNREKFQKEFNDLFGGKDGNS